MEVGTMHIIRTGPEEDAPTVEVEIMSVILAAYGDPTVYTVRTVNGAWGNVPASAFVD